MKLTNYEEKCREYNTEWKSNKVRSWGGFKLLRHLTKLPNCDPFCNNPTKGWEERGEYCIINWKEYEKKMDNVEIYVNAGSPFGGGEYVEEIILKGKPKDVLKLLNKIIVTNKNDISN